MTIEHHRGDILEVGPSEDCDLIIAFGHIGFSAFTPHWWDFKKRCADRFGSINDPFSELDGDWTEYRSGKFIVFIPTRANHGLTDGDLRSLLVAAFEQAIGRGLRTVITNGARDVDHGRNSDDNRQSDNNRRALVENIAQSFDAHFDSIKLISLNDIFTRNPS